MQQDLQLFIRDALVKGLSKEKIKEVLLQAKWPTEEIDNALAHFADVDFPLPVPKRKAYLSAKEAFLYLLLFLTLYISAYSLGAIVYQFINFWFPDKAIVGYVYDNVFSLNSIRWSLASLIIGFPLFLWLSMMMERKAKKDPEIRSSRVRKWLTYLTLFATAGIMIGDFIVLLSRLLGGDITARFSLKFLTVLIISALIFWYYLTDLKQEEKEN